LGEFFGVDVWGSEGEKGLGSASAFGGVDCFKEAGSRVYEGGFEIGDVRAWFDPELTSGGLVAVPVFEFGDLEINAFEAREPRFAFDHGGEFADRQAILDGNGVLPNERCVSGFENIASDLGAAEGVGAVKDEKGDFGFGGGLHAEAKGADVGIEPGPDVLDIIDKDVEVF
jgi:hypothetical protein